MSTSVNYLLAASSHRIGKENVLFPSKEILRAHLTELAKTNTHALAQITILRAMPLERDANFAEDARDYWNVEELFQLMKCPVVVLDVKDVCYSYSSWVQAVMKWRTAFDYYVLMEDDYYPAHPRFVEILLAEHNKKLPSGGYLNGFTTNHAASSNGMVDSATMVASLDKLANPVEMSKVGQAGFGSVFCGDRLADYNDTYRCLFPMNTHIVELVHGDAENQPLYGRRATDEPVRLDLIRPIEYLVIGEQEFRKSISRLIPGV